MAFSYASLFHVNATVYEGALTVPRPTDGSVVTLGTFDGVHLGHRHLIQSAIKHAKIFGVKSIAYTFDPHPALILAPSKAPTLLISIEERVRQISALGVDIIVVEPFDRAFASIEAKQWLDQYLAEALNPKHVVVGFNFSYGYQRAGSPESLTAAGEAKGFEVEVVSALRFDEETVSSTRIRNQLIQGAVQGASELLGRPFCVRGYVIEGDKRGRTLGFPTANFLSPKTISPARGVYAVRIELQDERVFDGVMNFGARPTVDGGQELFEAHLFDFEGDLYGKEISVELLHRIRAEQKFDDLNALVAQIQRDANKARELLG